MTGSAAFEAISGRLSNAGETDQLKRLRQNQESDAASGAARMVDVEPYDQGTFPHYAHEGKRLKKQQDQNQDFGQHLALDEQTGDIGG